MNRDLMIKHSQVLFEALQAKLDTYLAALPAESEIIANVGEIALSNLLAHFIVDNAPVQVTDQKSASDLAKLLADRWNEIIEDIDHLITAKMTEVTEDALKANPNAFEFCEAAPSERVLPAHRKDLH